MSFDLSAYEFREPNSHIKRPQPKSETEKSLIIIIITCFIGFVVVIFCLWNFVSTVDNDNNKSNEMNVGCQYRVSIYFWPFQSFAVLLVSNKDYAVNTYAIYKQLFPSTYCAHMFYPNEKDLREENFNCEFATAHNTISYTHTHTHTPDEMVSDRTEWMPPVCTFSIVNKWKCIIREQQRESERER